MKNIILIDDVTDICEALSMLIKMKVPNISVDLASNGLEAIKLIKDKYYDLIITDLNMPILSGDEMILQLKKENINHGKIYIMSGYSENKNKQIEYDRYFSKPIELKELIQGIISDLK